MKAPLPPNEVQRLAVLRGYAILDTPPEAAFDDLTVLAAQICQTPIALVTLVDESRQWFKAQIGVNITETSRDIAFCAHAILYSDGILEVRDMQRDPRFSDNPLVATEPNLRFYAGAPLVAPEGLALGTLCVLDYEPRVLNAKQRNALRALSRTVVAELELRRALIAGRQLEERLQSLNASLEHKVEERTVQLKTAYKRVERLKKLYAALSQCNHAIVRTETEAELFPKICRDAVEFGGMKMAWVGRVDNDSQRVIPIASFGEGTEYLEGIQILVDADDPLGRGPIGTSIRENQPFWCQDFLHDPITAPWHERCAQFGWCAGASLPLHRNGVVIGVFALYADEADAFDEAARKLLIEMAMDISYALDKFDLEARHKQIEAALIASEQRLRTIIETEPECVKVVDPLGHLVEMNAAGLAMLEADSLSEAQQHTLIDYILPQYNDAFRALHKRVMLGESGTLEFEVLGLRGTRRWLETHAAPMRDAADKIVSLLGITRDISARKHAEERLVHMAHFDALTGLPNRTLFTDRINYALSMAQRSRMPLAVMFLDLDHFKNVNDTLGHRIGDALLIEIAKRLKSVMREEDTLSRMGGDEFILVLPGTDVSAAVHVAEKLLATVAPLCQIEQHEVGSTASVGIAMYPDNGEDFETLSKCADVAMYRAKRDGRNTFRFFTAEMQVHSARRSQLENALRHALKRDQLHLHYQPQMSLQDGRIIGAEALLRWQHPELGMVSPVEFIPIAEDSGLILPIGEWVLRTATQQLRSWMDQGMAPMVMAVNLSAVQFRHVHLPGLVTQILDSVKLPPQYLELELTEGIAMDDALAAIAVMDSLHERGIRMSID
ncbi:MAG: diguanylate cyclase, partial [Gallionella sp.]